MQLCTMATETKAEGYSNTHTQTHRIETAEIISLLFELIKNSSTNKS